MNQVTEIVRDKILKAGIKNKGGVSLQIEKSNNLFVTNMINRKTILENTNDSFTFKTVLNDSVLFHTEMCHPNPS